MISDPNQEINYWQGSPRYGWYDAVLMRYSQKINNNDEIFISGIDQLSSCEAIKICNGYLYKGIIDEEFERTFEYIKESLSSYKELIEIIFFKSPIIFSSVLYVSPSL